MENAVTEAVTEDSVTIINPALQESTRLIQVKAPLDSAADAFVTRDALGRLPTTLIPTRANHPPENLMLAVIGLGILLAAAFAATGIQVTQGVLAGWWLMAFASPTAMVLAAPAFRQTFVVRIPEGASAILVRGGKYRRTIDCGTHLVPPWVDITHMVSRREIPFDISIDDAPTRDNVCAAVETLFTFTITDPYRFVFTLPPDEYDHVLQASCQEALRVLIRRVPAEEVAGLTWGSNDDLVQSITADMAPYGVQIVKMKMTYARPSAAFIRLQELRRLAALQQEVTQAAEMVGQAVAQDAQRQRMISGQATQPTLASAQAAGPNTGGWRESLARLDRLELEREALQIQIDLHQAEILRSASHSEPASRRVPPAHRTGYRRTFRQAV